MSRNEKPSHAQQPMSRNEAQARQDIDTNDIELTARGRVVLAALGAASLAIVGGIYVVHNAENDSPKDTVSHTDTDGYEFTFDPLAVDASGCEVTEDSITPLHESLNTPSDIGIAMDQGSKYIMSKEQGYEAFRQIPFNNEDNEDGTNKLEDGLIIDGKTKYAIPNCTKPNS